jgi:ABC-type lipoprotein release transport system permease subunit
VHTQIDPVILGAAALILGRVRVAGLIPAVRASSVDPVQALRVNN